MDSIFSQLFSGSHWLIEPKALRALIAQAAAATPDAVQAAMKAYSDRPSDQPAPLVGDVAVIAMNGPIVYRSSWMSMYFGFATIETMQAQLRTALADPAVRAICFRCDSPGGIVDMVPEFAEEIFKARGQKPMTFVADVMIASCAYWLAAQGDQVVVTRSSRVGAIGTYCTHEDISGMLEKAGIKVTLISHGDHKTDGNPYEPLSDSARAAYQAYADEVGDEFDTAVARGRGVTKKVVLDTFGQGALFRGKAAIATGLADQVGTFTQVLTKLTKGKVAVGLRGTAPGETPAVDAAPALEGATPTVTGKKTTAETVDPVDGECPDGYELGDDGMCHLDAEPEEVEARVGAPASADVEAEHEAIIAALTD